MMASEEKRIRLIKFYDLLTYLMLVSMFVIIIFVTLNRHLIGMSRTFVVNYTFDVCALVFATALFGSTVIHDREVNRESIVFRTVIFELSAVIFAEATGWLIDGRPELIRYNILLNELQYLATAMTLFFFWIYMRLLLKLPKERYSGLSRHIRLLFIADAILIITNPATKLFFYFSEDGFYTRAALYPVSQIFNMTVLVSCLVISLRTDMPVKQKIALSLYSVIPIITVVISMFIYGISIICPSSFAAVMICFLNIYLRKSGELAEKKNEMDYAKVIQTSMLPAEFDGSAFGTEVYGLMRTAREVGGDFYDYYMLDDTHLVLIIADVAGKGLPAAMFMVQGITTIKNYITSGFTLEEAMQRANESLCYNNDADLFITCWAGVLDICTGNIRVVNAGHCFPIIRKADGETSVAALRSGLPLAAMSGISYRPKEIVLEKGDTMLLYTDGVTEAHSVRNELFGEDRLLQTVSSRFTDAKELNNAVIRDVDRFSIGKEQFDDITMVTVRRS